MTRMGFADIACLRGDRLLFEGMTFALASGDAALVSGPNGSGKSSLLRIAAGLLRPAAGDVVRDGGVAWLGEQPALDSQLPLADALRFWARIDGGDVGAALYAMGIERLAEVPVRMLSTGQRKRAGLARVLLGGAPIWLLDEPGNGLDVATVARLESVIREHRAAGGIVMVATHQPLDIGPVQEIALI